MENENKYKYELKEFDAFEEPYPDEAHNDYFEKNFHLTCHDIFSYGSNLKYYFNRQFLHESSMNEKIIKSKKILDFPNKLISEDFIYYDAVDKIKDNIPKFEEEIKDFDINFPIKENIFKSQAIQSFIEDIFNKNIDFEEKIKKDMKDFKKHIISWRKVKEDGNDFYRSAIFSWLEYLVFNKKIIIFQLIIANLILKFDNTYENTKKLSKDLTKEFINEKNLTVSLTILEIIIRNLSKNDIETAYKVLIKGFNASNAFDKTMIYYLKYLIYEFILENGENIPDIKNKVSKDKIMSEEFLSNMVLKFSTPPEDIIIFLTPFVLKVNIILIKYFPAEKVEPDCKSKIMLYFLWCGLSNKDDYKDSINILYRSNFYIGYSSEYNKDNETFLNIYYDKENEKNYIVNLYKDDDKAEKVDKVNNFDNEGKVVKIDNIDNVGKVDKADEAGKADNVDKVEIEKEKSFSEDSDLFSDDEEKKGKKGELTFSTILNVDLKKKNKIKK